MDYKSYGDYKVYDNGTVWSNRRNIFLKLLPRGEYLAVKLYGKLINIHRLMGQLFLPNFENLPTVEHKDKNKFNNSLFNLKWETRCNQQQNRKTPITNTSGVKGVCYIKGRNKWRATMIHNKKKINRSFDTKEEAILYRKELEVLSGLPYF